MSPRQFIRLFYTPLGGFLVFIALFSAVLLIVKMWKGTEASPKKSEPIGLGIDLSAPSSLNQIKKDPAPFNLPPQIPVPEPPKVTTQASPPAHKTVPPIRIYAEPPTDRKEESTILAPFGRLLRAELVITVDSSSIETPILGLVLEDLWYDGKLIIEAGSEIHGKAQLDRSRDRIASQGLWTVVSKEGTEMRFPGIALDQEINPSGGYDITDGSAGLRGEIVRSDRLPEIKLFAASFISGLTQFARETTSTGLGSQLLLNARNAAQTGASSVLDSYAERILESIRRDGVFVRVPAGKQFYVYVTDRIRPENSSTSAEPTRSINSQSNP